MRVTVLYRQDWYCWPATVDIADTCPVCGGPRGEVFEAVAWEEGDVYFVDCWENPCGHVDTYEEVLREAGYGAKAAQLQRQMNPAQFGIPPRAAAPEGIDW